MKSSSSAAGRAPVSLIVVLALAAGACEKRPAAQGGGDAPGAGTAAFVYNAAQCASSPDMPASGWDYPQTAATVQSWVASRDVNRARTHGWWLWAALNQNAATPGGTAPLWRGWCTSTQAYAATGGEPPAANGDAAQPKTATPAAQSAGLALGANRDSNNDASSDPIQLPGGPTYPVPASLQKGKCYQNGGLTDGASFANNGDVMIAGVIYNPVAYNWIRSTGSYLQSTLQQKLPPKGQIGSMGQMPAGSIVLKPMMWPVPASGFSALPLWDNPIQDNGLYAGFENQKLWPRAVAVSARPTRPSATDVTYLYGGVKLATGGTAPVTYRQAPIVTVDQFYNYQPDLSRMEECDRALLDASAIYAYNRPFQQGDYLILIAMHIMTKEQPAWTFQSVFWSDRPDEGQQGKDKPIIPAAQGPWRHYQMASTYGMAASTHPPVWGVHFNPYIELAADHPIQTNCMNCHSRAAYPSRGAAKTGQYLTSLPTDPGKIGVVAANNPIFQDLEMTDNQWSLPNRAKGLQSPPAPGGSGGKAKR